MISIPKKVEELIRESAYQSVSIRVEPLKGSPFNITSQDIEEGSFTIQRDCISVNELEIGNMTASELKMTLRNPYDAWGFGKYDHIAFCGAKLTCTLRIHDASDDSMYEIPYGVFTVDQQPRMLENIEIAALDNLMRLDIPFDGSKLPDSLSVQYLVREGINAAGLDCPEEDLKVFPDYHGLEDDTEMRQAMQKSVVNPQNITSKNALTWRQVIMWCCQCAGVCGYADETGAVRFRFYQKYTPDVLQSEDGENLLDEDGEILLLDGAPQGDFELPASARFMDGSDLEESDVVLTGHQFKEEDALYPADAVMDYGLQTEGNLVFAAAATPERAKTNFAALANDAVAGFTYRPFSCSTLSFPQLEPMDGIDYVKNGRHYHSVIMSMTFKLNGEMKLAAKAKSKVQKGYASLGALTPGQQVIIDSISQSADKTHLQLTDYENALLLFNEQMFNAMGLYKTTEEKNGGIIVYFHDAPTLEDSETIYMFGSNGFAWTENGWQGGEPVWNYGVTSGGEALLSKIHAYVISAELIKTGRLQSQNGASWIDMDDGTFSFGCFVPTGDMDLDTGEAVYELQARLKLSEEELSVYGTIRGLGNNKHLYLKIGATGNNYGALLFGNDNTGELFAVRDTLNQSGNGAFWYVPMLSDKFGSNPKGIQFLPDGVNIVNSGQSGLRLSALGEAALQGDNAWIRTYRDQINIATSSSHKHIWINYYSPISAYSLTANLPTAYDFGDGTEGGHAAIYASQIGCGYYPKEIRSDVCAALHGIVTIGDFSDSNFFYTDYKLSVYGTAKASSWDVVSDPAVKENMTEVEINAIQKLADMKFFSYDIKSNQTANVEVANDEDASNSISISKKISAEEITNEEVSEASGSEAVETVHIPMGIDATQAPKEIQSADGKGINLYSYISLCAKAIQELTAKVEAQEERIAALETRIAELEA